MIKKIMFQRKINKMIKEGMSKEHLLKKLADEGYLFHGSNKKIRVLKPKKVNLKGTDKSTISKVSATPFPEYAMFFSITSKRGEGKTSVINNNGKLKFSAEKKVYNEITPGYVHIIKGPKLGGKFTRKKLTEEELISIEPVEVDAIIRIEPKDFKHKIEVKKIKPF